MGQKFSTDIFWFSLIDDFLKENYLWLIVCAVVLVLIGRKAFSYRTMEPAPWKKAFWICLTIAALSNAWFLYASYESVTGQSNSTTITQPARF